MKNLRHLLKDSKAAQVAPPITSAGLTAEIVFVPALVQGNLPGSHVVAAEILAAPEGVTGIPLTEAQRRRLERFITQNPTCPYRESLNQIRARGCWYEQESFPFSEGE